MKESELNSVVMQRLAYFEEAGSIIPSAGWNDSLMIRISSVKPGSTSKNSATKYTVILVFILLVNLSFIFNSFIRNSGKSFTRNTELNVISTEMMVNPVSINK
jgi:hypothetical protein